MKRAIGRRGLRIGMLAAALLAVAGGIAYAAIPDGNGVYTACKLNATGTIRLIDPSLGSTSLLGHCASLETQVGWNEQGQRGPAGPKGDAGPAGPAGGLSGYEIDQDGAFVIGNTSLTATCAAGKKAIGGGGTIDTPNMPDAVIAGSHPTASGDGWTIDLALHNDFGQVTVYAVCITA